MYVPLLHFRKPLYMRWPCGPCAHSHTLINGFISYHVLGTVALWVVCSPDATHAARLQSVGPCSVCMLSSVPTSRGLTFTTARFKALSWHFLVGTQRNPQENFTLQDQSSRLSRQNSSLSFRRSRFQILVRI